MTIQPETPHSRKTSSNDQYTSGNLDSGGEALFEDYGRVPEVTVDLFFRSALPPVESGLVDKVIRRLEADGRLVLGDNPEWTSFSVRPSDCDGTENKVFRAFHDIYKDIIAACKHESPNRKETVKLFQRPNNDIPSDDPNTSRPDGYLLVVADGCGTPNWKDIPMTCEYKKGTGSGDRVANARQILWNMHHSMRNGYQRFTYGLTIEDLTVRMWLCDRSENMVSQPFELDKEPGLLIHLFLALSFATRPELGFDPTIERLSGDRIRISVHSKRNGTQKVAKFIAHVREDVLAKYGADPMNGRGTRVWRVYDEENPGEFYVLKDVWVNPARSLEGDTLRDFEKDIEQGGCAEDLAQFKKSFMTVMVDGVVMIDSDEDRTLELIRRGVRPRDRDFVTLYAPQEAARVETDAKSVARMSQVPHSHFDSIHTRTATKVGDIVYCPRVHYRIVVKELGTTLGELNSMSEFLDCLPEVVDGIGLLHKYNRLHRDISTGNVIVCIDKANGAKMVKLSDLEYARKGTEGGHDDERTGTYQFMATEVRAGKYLFLGFDRCGYEWSALTSHSPIPPWVLPPQPFRHNVLHDLESVWWIALWQFLYKYESLPASGSLPPERLAKLKKHEHRLFDPSDAVYRQALIHTMGNEIDELSALLPPAPVVLELVTRFSSHVQLMRSAYLASEGRWNEREVVWRCMLQKSRQFFLGLVQAVSESV